MVIGLVTHIVSGIDITRLLFNLFHFAGLLLLAVWVYALVARFSPSGIACCGDFEDYKNDYF